MYAVLMWGSLMALFLSLVYYVSNRKIPVKNIDMRFILSKLCYVFAYLCLFFRGVLPDFLSVVGGNGLLFLGFYFETLSLLRVGEQGIPKMVTAFMTTLLTISISIFILMELFGAGEPYRVPAASAATLMILILPAIFLLFEKGSVFKRMVGLLYLGFCVLMAARTVYSLVYFGVNTFTNFSIQSVTYLYLLLLMVASTTAYLLLSKERTDELISRMATTDFLTNIPNRGSFLKTAEERFEKCRQRGDGVALIFLDLDDFKLVNDRYGHDFGDIVLQRIGQLLQHCVRREDAVCRYGGEEFLIYLHRVDAAAIQQVANRILEMARVARFREHPVFQLTVSLGLAGGVPQKEETLAQFISRADEALYLSKRGGKDRFSWYGDTAQQEGR